jgi:predicted O-linked N-acetylglucosamine transferase (SPINDLY family)
MMASATPPDLRTALFFHQAGQLNKAANIYREILAHNPDNHNALHYLGLLEAQMGHFERARPLIARSLELQPANKQVRENYATILVKAGRHDSAIQTCNEGLRSDPTNACLLYVSATAFFKLRRLPESLRLFDKLLTVQPDHVVSINERGSVLAEMKEYDQALAAFQKAVTLNPKFADAHLNIGNLLGELERHEEAKSSFEKALELNPRLARAWSGLGNILRRRRAFDEALAVFAKALALEPDLAEAWLGRGNVYTQLKQHDNAFAAFDRAVSLEPNLAAAWLGRGNVYTQLTQHDNAFAAFDKALSLEPDIDYAESLRLHSKTHLCDWTELEAETARLLARVREGKEASSPFVLLPLPCTAADQLRCAERFMKDLPVYSPVWLGESYSHDRIRIAYLSADFRNHPVAQLTAGLFEHHDKSRFEVTGISIGSADDSPLRRRLESAFEHFIDAADKTDADIARLIRDREIDIAVDLMGHTTHSRPDILAQRAAPIQVHYLGYAGTLGAHHIDYIVADSTVVREEHRRFFTEQVVWLPDSYFASDDRRAISPRMPTRRECGLPEAGFVFCSFNNSYKITPTMFQLWMRLLQATPNSILWLRQVGPIAMANLRREAERHGVSPQRLVFASRVAENADHLARQRQADLFLDTLPYNAHTTASDALWAGLPVLTCLGETFAGRVAASLLRAIGLPELVAESLKEYEALALKLAHDPALLVAIKAKLGRHREVYPLFDTARFTRHIEAAYVTMWERYQRGMPPEAFTVST